MTWTFINSFNEANSCKNLIEIMNDKLRTLNFSQTPILSYTNGFDINKYNPIKNL